MTNTITRTIRPGLLVSLKTSVRGGVRYERVDLENRTEAEPGADGAVAHNVARWETTREIIDVTEFQAAMKARERARGIIGRVCCRTSFGLLCTQPNEAKLYEAVAEAQAVAEAHNAKARHTSVDVYVITGRVADNDEQAARAIASEVRELIDAMQAGIKSADPDAIRMAANKARSVAGMLAPEVEQKVTAAIAEVRTAAREIVRRVGEAGETAASVVDSLKLERLTAARFAVLDVGDEGGGDVGERVVVEAAGRAIDFEPAPVPAPDGVSENHAPAIELDLGDVAEQSAS